MEGGRLARATLVFDHPAVGRMDRAGERIAAGARGRSRADRALYLLSRAADHSVLWHTVNLIDAAVGVAVLRGQDRRTHVRRALRRSAVLGLEQALVNGPVKGAFRRVRPDHVEDHPHRLRTPRTSSFPSGHASAGACAAVLLSEDLGAAPLWWALASTVAWSRIHVGAHHTSDVIGGALIGAAGGAAAGRVWPPPGERAGHG